MRGRRTLTLAVIAAGAAVVAPAHAAEPTLDPCSDLQQRLDTATEVTIDGKRCTGTYTISRDVVVRGANGGGFGRQQVTGEPTPRSLTISNAAHVTLANLTFVGIPATQGRASTGITSAGGVSFDALDAPVGQNLQARADAAAAPGSLTVTDSVFTDLEADSSNGQGGALYADLWQEDTGERASVSVTGSRFEGNHASFRGGGMAVYVPKGEQVTGAAAGTPAVAVSGSTFDGNGAGQTEGPAAGGGLFVGAYVPFISSFAARGDAPGGGDYDVVLNGNDYTNNRVSSGSGGGAEFQGVDVSSERENYLSNRVIGDGGEGGGVSVRSIDVFGGNEVPTRLQGSFTAVNAAIAGNAVDAEGYGAGVYGGTEGGCNRDRRDVEPSECGTTIDLVHSTVAGNAGGPGASAAGIGIDDGDALSVDRSIVWGNTNAPERPDGEDEPRAPASDEPEIETDGGDLSVTRSDYCELRLTRAADEAGNLCVDPLLVDAAYDEDREPEDLPDVHQTPSSPTIDAVTAVPASRGTATVVAGDFERPTADPRSSGARPDMGADEVVPPVETTPENPKQDPPANQGTAPQQQLPGTVQVLPQVDRSPAVCKGLRFFRITLRKNRGPFKAARIWVNGKRVKVTITRRGRATTRVDLRRFQRTVIRVRIVATTTEGKRLRGRRTYNPCRPSLDDGVPPRL